ncbi:MAG: glycosyltransferase family 2 protein [bacterium]
MFNNKTVSVVIPAYNEEETIGDTIAAVKAGQWADEIVVVDDGSRDGSRKAAARAGAAVVSIRRNKGKGNAMNEGVWQTRGEVVVFIDADLGESAVETLKLVEAVASGRCDLAVGSFTTPGGFGIAKRTARWGVRKLGGISISAPMSGQRAMARPVLKAAYPFQKDFGVEVKMLIDTARAGFRVLEIPVDMRHRASGRNFAGFIHRGKQFWSVLKALTIALVKRRRVRQ